MDTIDLNQNKNLLLVNGEIIKTIYAEDRGLQFGDGCFTTAAISRGKVVLLSAHIERLRIACKRLRITFLNWFQLEQEMMQLAAKQERAVLKVIITRGYGGCGYGLVHCKKPTRIVSVIPWPIRYKSWRKRGIKLSLSPLRIGRNPYLAGLKHLNRLEQVLIYAYLERTTADEMLVLDSDGWVIECCTANVFWRKNNIVYTPRLDQAGVNGVMRQFCLQVLLTSHFQVQEVYANEVALTKADEVIICNSLMPIVPVFKYGHVKFFSRKLFKFLIPFCDNPDSE